MKDHTPSSSLPLGEVFPDDFAHRVIQQARRERVQHRSRLAATISVVLLFALLPLNHWLRHNTETTPPSDLVWQNYSVQANQLADAAAPAEVGDYLAPDTTTLSNDSGFYADAAWHYDSDWDTD